MYHDLSTKYKGKYPPLDGIDVKLYEEAIGEQGVEELKQLAAPLENKTWAHVNSTFEGGGVAEMLRSIVPLIRGLGINSKWYCLEGSNDFFVITKKFHNLIQGVHQEYSAKDLLETYIETNKKNFTNNPIIADMTVVHDPQPSASIVHGEYLGKTVWRCHIDTSAANELIWNFLLPYINHFDASVFTMNDFVKPGVRIPAYKITPAIDPLNVKNNQYSRETALKVLEPLAMRYNIDLERPMILAVSRYDIHKNQKTIVDAFKDLKKDPEIKRMNPILVMVGNSASDDPEGQAMYDQIVETIDGDEDIYPLLNIENNDMNIGALMRVANHYVHVSTREGFGLVVTEAMWQGCPVIGSKVGGIVEQVIDHETGFLVEPLEAGQITSYMKYFLQNPVIRNNMAEKAVEHVRNNFLVPTLVKKYLHLMRYLLEIDKEPPIFKIG
ncbi:MAG: glycosyltransferase [Bacteroidales bacterium]|nr:glycosyltransferase [Bacteroidales bacterium]